MTFNEDSRVKIPAIIHLTRLGYNYLPKIKMVNIHGDTNIFVDRFKEGISLINSKKYSESEIDAFIKEISNKLDNNDLGRGFYKSLCGDFTCKLIDFENFDNNIFDVVTELSYKNGEEEFRPDITVLINGMPLVFVEVKKPNNREGILAERKRIDIRFRNPMFKKFMNISQLLIFSNNNEYDEEESVTPIQGAFYATPDNEKVVFNCFREEDPNICQTLGAESEDIEKLILVDNNLVSILGSVEYETNKKIDTPTNRLLTSLLSKSRIKTILKYGIAYARRLDRPGSILEKQIMRYPQLFATYAIENKLKNNFKKGIIWHTQGSGKTALAFYNVFYLRDYYQKQNTIAKFYFIVDRLDLAIQAKDEFEGRGLKVEMVSSREDFVKNIKTAEATAINLGVQTITVVNIQKFSSESISTPSDYNLNVQRVYFLDEVHRSYNPQGSFLANLITSDREAVMIGLTGTPLIMGEYKSKELFGDYIHKYYYNKSIADGYTLRLIREAIETKFRNEINDLLKTIQIQHGTLTKSEVFAHEKFVTPLVKYIVDDFKKSRVLHNDNTIGGMIVCDTSDQARKIFEELKKCQDLSSCLILCDVDTKDIRKDNQAAFKRGEIDLLVVFNMLLTGFDSKRLKKLYLVRIVREHNLLQTLTRVNRPYNNFRYGYIVDFADIREEFDKTNKEYFKELQNELGDEVKLYSNIFKSPDEIEAEIAEIKEKLFLYNFSNLEEFQKIVSQINDKKELQELSKNLENLRSLYNVIKIFGYTQLFNMFSFDRVNKLCAEVSNRIDILNLKDSLENSADATNLLNIALEKIQFTFKKIAEHELKIADKFREELERARKGLEVNFDKKDPQFISLYEELKRLFKKKNIEELTSEEMNDTIVKLKSIYDRVKALNLKDLLLLAKYKNDVKFARIHKRIKESNFEILKSDILLNEILLSIKEKADSTIINNRDIVKNQDFFATSTSRTVLEVLEGKQIERLDMVKFINTALVSEYLNERMS